MSAPENPPAFPVAEVRIDGIGVCEGSPGMTLRDWFAGQALAAMPRLGDTDASTGDIAHDAFRLADAMLVARESAK